MESKAKLTDNCHPFSHIIVASPVGALNNFDPGSWKLKKTFIAVVLCFFFYEPSKFFDGLSIVTSDQGRHQRSGRAQAS